MGNLVKNYLVARIFNALETIIGGESAKDKTPSNTKGNTPAKALMMGDAKPSLVDEETVKSAGI